MVSRISYSNSTSSIVVELMDVIVPMLILKHLLTLGTLWSPELEEGFEGVIHYMQARNTWGEDGPLSFFVLIGCFND